MIEGLVMAFILLFIEEVVKAINERVVGNIVKIVYETIKIIYVVVISILLFIEPSRMETLGLAINFYIIILAFYAWKFIEMINNFIKSKSRYNY